METRKRLYWVDNARAIAMISMIVYHIMWDLVYLYGVKAEWYHGKMAFIWQQSICWTFIFLAGFCSHISKRPIKQGMIINFWGIVIMAVTQVFMPGNGVWFGVLTLIGSCYLLVGILHRVFDKIPAWVGVIGAVICFVITYPVSDGYIGSLGLELFDLPKSLYHNMFTAYLGFPQRGFSSTDYFPLIPWMFWFFCGVFGHVLWKKYRPEILESSNIRLPIISALGRYSLVIYVLHQPLIYGFLEMIFK